jgi:hypothetical protein
MYYLNCIRFINLLKYKNFQNKKLLVCKLADASVIFDDLFKFMFVKLYNSMEQSPSWEVKTS